MATRLKEVDPDSHIEDRNAQLEKGIIDDYLKGCGLDPATARQSADSRVKDIVTKAVMYASGQLATIECRAHLVNGLHGAPSK